MRILVKFAIAILNLIFTILKLLPVKDKITFISRQANEKSEDMIMLEEEIRRISPDLQLVFLCKKIEAGILSKVGYCLHMLRQMYHIATSRVVALDSYCIAVSVLKQRESLVVVQMWHALGSLKRFGLSVVGEAEGTSERLANLMKMHRNYTYVLTSGAACLPNFAEAFGYNESHMRIMSLPRVDRITDEAAAEEARQRIYERYPEFRTKKVVTYATTFRKHRDISEDIDRLAKQFGDDYVFVLKKHPLMDVSCTCLVDEAFSTLEMLFASDYVICDYSAVIYEAALLGKPLFFYTFDYEDYGVDRDFYIDYKSEMPGVISPDPEVIAEAVKRGDYDLERVRAFSNRYIENQSGCTETLAKFLCGFSKREE